MNERLSGAINTWAFNYALKGLSFSNCGNTDFYTYKDKEGIVWYVTPFFAARPASNDVHVRGREMGAFPLLDEGFDFEDYEHLTDTGMVLQTGTNHGKVKLHVFKTKDGTEVHLRDDLIKPVIKYCPHFMRHKTNDNAPVLILDEEMNLIAVAARRTNR